MARTIGITYTVEATLAFGTGPEVTYGLLLDLDTRQYYALYGAGFNVGIGAPAGATANFIFSNNVPAELNGYVAGFEQTAVGGLNLGVGGVLNGIGNGSGSGQLQVGPDVGIQAYFGGALVTPIVEEEIYNTFPSLVSQYEILKSFSDNNITDFSIDHEASYSNQLRYFDSDNEFVFEYTGETDGSSSVVNYERDFDSLVDNQTKYFDSDNNLYFEQTLNRDGSRSEIEYFSDLDAAVANQRRFYDSDLP